MTYGSIIRGLLLALFVALVLPVGTVLGSVTVFSADVVLIPLLGVLFADATLARHRRLFRVYPEEKLLAAFLFVLLASSILSVRPFWSLDVWLHWLRAGVVYFVLRYCLFYRRVSLKELLRDLQICWVILMVVGLVQVVTGTEFGLISNYVGEKPEEVPTVIRRISGTSREINVFAQWVALLSLLVNTRLLMSRGLNMRLFALPVAVLLELAVLVATLSRASLLFFFVGNALVVWIWVLSGPRRGAASRISFLGGTTLVVLLAAFILYEPDQAVSAVMERFDTPSDIRVHQIENGLALLKQPKVMLAGTGLGAFYPAVEAAGLPVLPVERWRYVDTRVSIHNVFFLLAVEGGLITLVLFAVFYLRGLLASFRTMRRVRLDERAPFGIYLFVAAVGLLLIPMQFYMSAAVYPTVVFVMAVLAMGQGLRAELSAPPRGASFARGGGYRGARTPGGA